MEDVMEIVSAVTAVLLPAVATTAWWARQSFIRRTIAKIIFNAVAEVAKDTVSKMKRDNVSATGSHRLTAEQVRQARAQTISKVVQAAQDTDDSKTGIAKVLPNVLPAVEKITHEQMVSTIEQVVKIEKKARTPRHGRR